MWGRGALTSASEEDLSNFAEGISTIIEFFNQTDSFDELIVEKLLAAVRSLRGFDQADHEVILQGLPGDTGGPGRLTDTQ